MKRISILIVTLIMVLTACNNAQKSVETPKNDYKFLSVSWGEDWESVQKSDALQGAESEVGKDNGRITYVSVKNIDFCGKPVEALLSFGNEKNDAKGLYDVTIRYQENDEEDILSQMTEIYGELQTSYIDKNGIPNPINPAGWYTEERLETVLTETEKEEYINQLKYKEQTYIDAILRTPMVIIFFDKETNTVRYSSLEAFVKTIRE